MTTKELQSKTAQVLERLHGNVMQLAWTLLTDDNGVSEESYSRLLAVIHVVDDQTARDVARLTEGSEGRVYLPSKKEQSWPRLP